MENDRVNVLKSVKWIYIYIVAKGIMKYTLSHIAMWSNRWWEHFTEAPPVYATSIDRKLNSTLNTHTNTIHSLIFSVIVFLFQFLNFSMFIFLFLSFIVVASCISIFCPVIQRHHNLRFYFEERQYLNCSRKKRLTRYNK